MSLCCILHVNMCVYTCVQSYYKFMCITCKKKIYTVCNNTRVNEYNVIVFLYVCKHCISLFVLKVFNGKTRLNLRSLK